MKKGKILRTLAIAGTCLCAPLLLSGCTSGNENKTDFRVYDGYIQVTKDGTTWENLVDLDTLKGLPGDDADVWTIGQNGNWFKNGVDTGDKAVGTDGVGITSITKNTNLSTSTVTVYDILFDNGTSSQIQIPNGEDGEPGDDADVWTIGDDGYWYKNGDKTEYKAVGEDATYSTYTITYDYNFGVSENYDFELSSLFDNYMSNQTISSKEWIQKMPKLKDSSSGELDGWYVKGTDKKVQEYDFIGGDVSLQARWKTKPSGAYDVNGDYCSTWGDLVREYSRAFAINGEMFIDVKDSSIKYPNIIIDSSITTIKGPAFSNSIVKNVTIPNSIVSISDNAFDNATSLEKIIVDKNNTNYTDINGILFDKNLTILIRCPERFENKIEIPYGISQIKESAFMNCRFIKSVSIPCSVTKIFDYTFHGCDLLEDISLPHHLISIGSYAFYSCDNLKEIILPNTLKTIGMAAFDYTGLTSIIIPKGVKINGSDQDNPICRDIVVYFEDSQNQYQNIDDLFYNCASYFYSETQPEGEGNYWHYDADGQTPIVWEVAE